MSLRKYLFRHCEIFLNCARRALGAWEPLWPLLVGFYLEHSKPPVLVPLLNLRPRINGCGFSNAGVVELVDTLDLGSSASDSVKVRALSPVQQW